MNFNLSVLLIDDKHEFYLKNGDLHRLDKNDSLFKKTIIRIFYRTNTEQVIENICARLLINKEQLREDPTFAARLFEQIKSLKTSSENHSRLDRVLNLLADEILNPEKKNLRLGAGFEKDLKSAFTSLNNILLKELNDLEQKIENLNPVEITQILARLENKRKELERYRTALQYDKNSTESINNKLNELKTLHSNANSASEVQLQWLELKKELFEICSKIPLNIAQEQDLNSQINRLEPKIIKLINMEKSQINVNSKKPSAYIPEIATYLRLIQEKFSHPAYKTNIEDLLDVISHHEKSFGINQNN